QHLVHSRVLEALQHHAFADHPRRTRDDDFQFRTCALLLSFTSPSCNRLSAVATMASSLDRGSHPSTLRACSFEAFFRFPSSGRICLAAVSRIATKRTMKFGICMVGTLFAQ